VLGLVRDIELLKVLGGDDHDRHEVLSALLKVLHSGRAHVWSHLDAGLHACAVVTAIVHRYCVDTNTCCWGTVQIIVTDV